MLFNGFPECGALLYVLECLVGECSRERQIDRKRIPCNGQCVFVGGVGVVCGDSDLLLCVKLEKATHNTVTKTTGIKA